MIAGGHGDMTGDVNARSARKQRVSHLPGALSATLEDRSSIYARIAKAAPLFLQEPKSPCRKNPRAQPWMDIDQPDTPRRAVDRIDDASQDGVKRFIAKRIEEVTDREIVGHPEFRYVGDHDLHVPASVLMSSRSQTGASDFGEDGGDLDATDSAEGPSSGLMHHSTISTSELHKSVAIGDSEVVECSGEHMPTGRHVVPSVWMVMFGLMGIARGVEPPVQHTAEQRKREPP